MPNLQPISRERHASQRFKRNPNYNYATHDAVTSLVVQELPQATLHLSIAFLASEGTFTPVALQGLQPGKNLFVDQNGQWLAGYVPAAYKAYPFVLANTAEGQQVLCIDEASGLLSQTEGDPFFAEDNQPGQTVGEVFAFLKQHAANSQSTARICADLQKHNLIQPWPIKLQGETGEQVVEGLYRIDEAALNQLPAEAFMELRNTGALLCAYCQLLSMQHIQTLGKLAEAQAKAAAPLALKNKADIDLSFLEGSETFKFF
jgi:SapC